MPKDKNLHALLIKTQKTVKRPRNNWRRSTLREAGRSWSGLRYLVADRDKWKKPCRNGKTYAPDGTTEYVVVVFLFLLLLYKRHQHIVLRSSMRME
jgi:hypothetical protein